MSTEVKVPQLPESVADATLVNWHKKVGEYVQEGENLVDLETDKVVLEMPAPASGLLTEIRQQDGATVVGGDLVAIIDETAAKPAAQAASAQSEAAPAQGNENKAVAKQEDAGRPSPAAKKTAAEAGVSTAEVNGSGRGGRVTKADVLKHLAGGAARTEERVPMTRMRQRIAERLLESQQQAAILTTFNEVNMKPIMDLRKKYQDRFVKENDIKLGFMSFFVKAAVMALKKFPAVNASIDGGDIIYHNYFDIGIAVSSPRGLVVPIVRDADQLSFAEIEQNIADYGTRARSGQLSIEDMMGGTFSITNGGIFGSMMSTPIINPPQSAILGMHNIVDRPVVENGEIVIRPIMYVALSYDHRLVDGRESVSFLYTIKEALEDPTRMLLNV